MLVELCCVCVHRNITQSRWLTRCSSSHYSKSGTCAYAKPSTSRTNVHNVVYIVYTHICRLARSYIFLNAKTTTGYMMGWLERNTTMSACVIDRVYTKCGAHYVINHIKIKDILIYLCRPTVYMSFRISYQRKLHWQVCAKWDKQTIQPKHITRIYSTRWAAFGSGCSASTSGQPSSSLPHRIMSWLWRQRPNGEWVGGRFGWMFFFCMLSRPGDLLTNLQVYPTWVMHFG